MACLDPDCCSSECGLRHGFGFGDSGGGGNSALVSRYKAMAKHE